MGGHAEDCECVSCTRSRRGCLFPLPCECGALCCKSIQISPQATPNRRNHLPPSVSVPPSHWKNQATQARPGGARMPIYKANGDPLRHKEAMERGKDVDNRLAAVQSGYLKEVPAP